jgi:hypothetical protein
VNEYIPQLQDGETVEFRPHGRSMEPLIKSGQLVRVVPVTPTTPLTVNDIVLCRVGTHVYLHKIVAVGNGLLLIGNNKGRTNGWIHRSNVYGIRTELK